MLVWIISNLFTYYQWVNITCNFFNALPCIYNYFYHFIRTFILDFILIKNKHWLWFTGLSLLNQNNLILLLTQIFSTVVKTSFKKFQLVIGKIKKQTLKKKFKHRHMCMRWIIKKIREIWRYYFIVTII